MHWRSILSLAAERLDGLGAVDPLIFRQLPDTFEREQRQRLPRRQSSIDQALPQQSGLAFAARKTGEVPERGPARRNHPWLQLQRIHLRTERGELTDGLERPGRQHFADLPAAGHASRARPSDGAGECIVVEGALVIGAGINWLPRPLDVNDLLLAPAPSCYLRVSPTRGEGRSSRLAKSQVDALAAHQRMFAIGERGYAVKEQP